MKFLLKYMHKKDMKSFQTQKDKCFFFSPKIDKYVLWS